MPTLCLSKQDQGGSTRPAKARKENVMAGGDIGNIGKHVEIYKPLSQVPLTKVPFQVV